MYEYDAEPALHSKDLESLVWAWKQSLWPKLSYKNNVLEDSFDNLPSNVDANTVGPGRCEWKKADWNQ